MQISSHSLSEFSSRGRQIEMANRLDSPHGVKVTNPHSHRRLHESRLILITSHGSSCHRRRFRQVLAEHFPNDVSFSNSLKW